MSNSCPQYLRTCLLAMVCFYSMTARAGAYNYTGSWILKANMMSLSESDIGLGICGEYRLEDALSIQLEAGYAPYSHQESSVRSLNAFSLRPELRIYLPHRHRSKIARADMYTGLEFLIKQANTHFSEWQKETDNQGNTIRRLYDYKTRNFSLGPVFKLGVQMYIGADRRLVIDIGAGAGPVLNQVRHTGQPPPPLQQNDLIRIDPFSMNKRSGIYIHPQLDLRIGYRF
ncbi:DUF3575 domain-containing protein [Taibaiella chishuiensis]|uniref:Uncharacterized protein DUF3575 n=1 Tax=Taibaiella chishuiensis TaxID=1434707 RepID=A0A2P8DD45_9BACT|nr:DUF3575 domain-containing protein [Taibaiella chishuiensis]PSK95115.1 uncharacterized protein DUF3575 [Taibaiella chishuiensis]